MSVGIIISDGLTVRGIPLTSQDMDYAAILGLVIAATALVTGVMPSFFQALGEKLSGMEKWAKEATGGKAVRRLS